MSITPHKLNQYLTLHGHDVHITPEGQVWASYGQYDTHNGLQTIWENVSNFSALQLARWLGY